MVSFKPLSSGRQAAPSAQAKPAPKTFILEPILTPSGLVGEVEDDSLNTLVDFVEYPEISPEQAEQDYLNAVPVADAPDLPVVDDPYSQMLSLNIEEIEPLVGFDADEIEIVPFIYDPIPDIDFDSLMFVDADPLEMSADPFPYSQGYFTVGESGSVSIDFWFDGGGFKKGELAIFSLEGMADLEPGSYEFIQEASRRALSHSELGHIVIQDASEGAKFSGKIAHEGQFNQGNYLGEKAFSMKVGDRFAVMLVPNGSVQSVFNAFDPQGDIRPLFSLETANPNDVMYIGQIADLTGNGHTFVMEDVRVDRGSDLDYNDVVFHVKGATAQATAVAEMINPLKDWRASQIGQQLLAHANTVESLMALPPLVLPVVGVGAIALDTPGVTGTGAGGQVPSGGTTTQEVPGETQQQLVVPDVIQPELGEQAIAIPDVEQTEFVEQAIAVPDVEQTEFVEQAIAVPPILDLPDVKLEHQPLVGIIDTGLLKDNPDINYNNIVSGRDYVDADLDSLLNQGQGSNHGTLVAEVIAAIQDNEIGIDGVNEDAPIWVSRAVVSGKWAEALVEFVDAAKLSAQPNAVVNLSFDLTQLNPDGSISTRFQLTNDEINAIAYAQAHGVLIVAAAGNEAGELGAIAQATHQFDNVLAVGAANGRDRADTSNFGEGLDLVADVQRVDNGLGGTSAAAALVTGAVSQVWAANPLLSYQQVVDVLKRSAIDIAEVGFDPFTGAGLIDLGAAISLAKITLPDAGAIALGELAQTGYVVGDGVSQERPANPANLPFYNGVRGGLLRREARSLKLLV